MILFQLIFWLSGFMILYIYIGYPALLRLLCVITKPPKPRADDIVLPGVSLLISAYNAEGVIDAKLRNALELDYPRDRLEIIVVSDGSTDRTTEIVSRFAGSGILLRHFEERTGKTRCLNEALPAAKGAIIVFSDANSTYDRNALKELVKHFSDETIGFVTGRTHYVSPMTDPELTPIGLYSRIETMVKECESALGSCIGADGAIFAVRKELYRPLGRFDINDLVVPFMVIEQGFRGMLEPNAVCTEEKSAGAKEEFVRQIRISNRTIRALLEYRYLANPFRFGFLSFQLLSHKLGRMFVPFLMATLLASNLVLLMSGAFYIAAFIGQALLYWLATAGRTRASFDALTDLRATVRSFMLVNLAILVGWVTYLKGETYATWRPSHR
jgi:cellulose synthase/poly-beta-1,6-N-acetylglucosamine synthase-like glycosyltransferase